MPFADAVRHAIANWSDFRSRARRSEFWWFTLFGFLVSALASIVDRILFGMADTSIVSALVSLALIVPAIAVAVRRLHDTDRSGWWLLLAFVPVVGPLVLIWFYVTRGTAGANRFGADPLSRRTIPEDGAGRSDIPRVDR